MKKVVLFSLIVLCATLPVSVYFASQPSQQKSFWDKSLTEHAQNFRKWIGNMYQKTPSAEKTAFGAAGVATAFGKVDPSISVPHAAGGYMAYQGVKQAWNAILNGDITSSLAAGTFLVLGLNFSVMPTANTLSTFDMSGNSIAQKAQTVILALGIGVTAAGLISTVYHNLIAPITKGEIPQTEVVDQTLKNTVQLMVEATIDDDIAYPTPSSKRNELRTRTDLLVGGDTDKIIVEVCNNLVTGKKYSLDSLSDKEKEIDVHINLLENEMNELHAPGLTKRINYLTELIKKDENFNARSRAAISLLLRLRSRLSLDSVQATQGRAKRPELTSQQKSDIQEYAKERTKLYDIPK